MSSHCCVAVVPERKIGRRIKREGRRERRIEIKDQERSIEISRERKRDWEWRGIYFKKGKIG